MFVGFVACRDNNKYINPKELIDAELALLDRYYNQMMDNEMTRLDSMSAIAIDTVDNRFESGLMLFHTKIGDGDSVKLFKRVGYRFKAYSVTEDSLGVTRETYSGSNEYAAAPTTYVTYILNDANAANSTKVALGINEALQHMRLNGESKIVLPSTIGGVNGYFSTVYEIKVTYLEH